MLKFRILHENLWKKHTNSILKNLQDYKMQINWNWSKVVFFTFLGLNSTKYVKFKYLIKIIVTNYNSEYVVMKVQRYKDLIIVIECQSSII
jgi:hypothetical protein